MLRRTRCAAASAIPRAVWDPQHHDKKWVDSFAKPIADRRVWPAKKYSIGLEPQTPVDWTRYSKRNLAYAYNAALRACATFPEMVPYYSEMKVRGVQVDLDTAFVLLSRAARYDKMDLTDVFALYDELTLLGARSDAAVAEVLHTVWDHSAGLDADWRESRRRQLVDLYNSLALEEIRRLGPRGYDKLMLQQLGRYRSNLKALGSTLRHEVWAAALQQVRDAEDLPLEVAQMLWDRAPSRDHPHVMVVQKRGLSVPVISDVLRRSSDDSDGEQLWAAAAYAPATEAQDPTAHFEDHAVSSVFLAALQRLVDHDFGLLEAHPAGAAAERQLLGPLFHLMWRSGVMLTGDVAAQVMDIVKYSPRDSMQDSHAMRYYRYALQAAAVPGPQLAAWRRVQAPASDCRVVARYLAARNPWSPNRFAPEKNTFAEFPGDTTRETESATEEGEVAVRKVEVVRNGASVDVRWEDVQKLLDSVVQRRGRAGSSEADTAEGTALARTKRYERPNGVQLFTAQAVFLQRMYEADPRNLSVLRAVLTHLDGLKREMDVFFHKVANDPAVAAADEETPAAEGPETECWEALLATLRGMLDVLVAAQKNARSHAAKEEATALYNDVAALRQRMVEESQERFGAKFSMLWLQEM